MPPRKETHKSHKRVQGNSQCPSSSGGVIEPNFKINHENRYLFRDLQAYENFTGQFQERELCACYYFDKSTVTFHTREDNKTIEYIQHWQWEPLLNCNEPYLALTTRTFYANFQCRNNPFSLTSWACGKEVHLNFENLATWLNLPNEGEEIYLIRNWPRDVPESSDSYKKWFNRSNIAGASLYATSLPSLHRLLFLFINNILTPKSKLKTNIEHGAIYYLRHLIQLDDTKFNMPYIIIRHMISAYSSSVASLPYAHVIHRIIRLNGTELPSNQTFLFPQNLVNQLTRTG